MIKTADRQNELRIMGALSRQTNSSEWINCSQIAARSFVLDYLGQRERERRRGSGQCVAFKNFNLS